MPNVFAAPRNGFDRDANGSLYDRGSADSCYGRTPLPHWYPNGTYKGTRLPAVTEKEIAEYMQGYRDNEASGYHK